MKMIGTYCLLSIGLTLFSWPGNHGAEPASTSSAKMMVAKKKKKSIACALLTVELLAEEFGVSAAEIENAKEESRYCKKRWISEIKEPQPRKFRNSVALQVTSFHTKEKAMDGFKKITSMLDPNMKRDEHAYITYTAYVEGIGDRAAWAKSIGQLSVVKDQRMIHITVGTSDKAKQLEHAKNLAKRILE